MNVQAVRTLVLGGLAVIALVTAAVQWPSAHALAAGSAPTLTAVVVLPTPPFWLATAITRSIVAGV